MRYFIEVSYNGKNYHGWQNQPNAISVQEVLEKALSILLQEKIAVIGAGRTDAGVHAKYFCAHFDYNKQIRNKKNPTHSSPLLPYLVIYFLNPGPLSLGKDFVYSTCVK